MASAIAQIANCCSSGGEESDEEEEDEEKDGAGGRNGCSLLVGCGSVDHPPPVHKHHDLHTDHFQWARCRAPNTNTTPPALRMWKETPTYAAAACSTAIIVDRRKIRLRNHQPAKKELTALLRSLLTSSGVKDATIISTSTQAFNSIRGLGCQFDDVAIPCITHFFVFLQIQRNVH